MARKFSSFAYKIDYDEAIRYDRTQLAALELSQHVCNSLPESVHEQMVVCSSQYGLRSAVDLLIQSHIAGHLDVVASLLNVEPSIALDILFWSCNDVLPSIPQRRDGSYNRAEMATGLLEWFQFDTEEGFRKAIKKTKASLARHLRNKERHGS